MEKFETKIQNENKYPQTTVTNHSATGLVLGPRTNIQMVLPYSAIDSSNSSKANNTSGSTKSVMTNNAVSHSNHAVKTTPSDLILSNIKQSFVNNLNQVKLKKKIFVLNN